MTQQKSGFALQVFLLSVVAFSVALIQKTSGKTDGSGSRQQTNIVKENPTLDVGPLILFTLEKGDTARLPCQTLKAANSVRIVLWYKNDKSKPFVSFDARERVRPSFEPGDHDPSHGEHHTVANKGRVFLSSGGMVLVIKDVRQGDEAEYRCTVHYSREPSIAQRIRLIIKENVHRVQIRDLQGNRVGKTIGPMAEGTRLSVACLAQYHHHLVNLEWLLDGQLIASSYAAPEDGKALSQVDLNVERRHAHSALTCRLTSTRQHGKREDLLKNGLTRSSSSRNGSHKYANLRHRGQKITDIDYKFYWNMVTSEEKVQDEDYSDEFKDGSVRESITDVSTVILLYYMPQATLLVDEVYSRLVDANVGKSSPTKGSVVHTVEDGRVKFICAVRARPPPYRISWLHNGKVMKADDGRVQESNTSLIIKPVAKDDSGLYTCLASNSEGDGHSNAIRLHVFHPPHCSAKPLSHLTTTKNTLLTLTCAVDSDPEDVLFTWRLNRRRPPSPEVESPHQVPEGGRRGPSSASPTPKLTDIPTGNGSGLGPEVQGSIHFATGSSPSAWASFRNQFYTEALRHRVDPTYPLKSLVTLTPDEDSIEVLCYAKNSVGRMRVPCTYAIQVMDPPEPPDHCKVLQVSATYLRVSCKTSESEAKDLPGLPGTSFVRSPDARETATLEVWSLGKLVTNVSSSSPDWTATGLPPDSDLRLRIYTSSALARSEPMILNARTLPLSQSQLHPEVNSSPVSEKPSEASGSKDKSTSQAVRLSDEKRTRWWMGMVATSCGVILVLLGILVIIILKRKTRTSTSEDTAIDAIERSRNSSSVWETQLMTTSSRERIIDKRSSDDDELETLDEEERAKLTASSEVT